jgi:hypothetical protein
VATLLAIRAYTAVGAASTPNGAILVALTGLGVTQVYQVWGFDDNNPGRYVFAIVNTHNPYAATVVTLAANLLAVSVTGTQINIQNNTGVAINLWFTILRLL